MVETYMSNAFVGEDKIIHTRQAVDISDAARLEITPKDTTIWQSVDKLPWFIKKIPNLEGMNIYLKGINNIEDLLMKWGLASGSLIPQTPYDTIKPSEFQKFTRCVINGISEIIDCPISDIRFSQTLTTSYFPELTREIDAEVSLIDTMQQSSLFFQANKFC
jgi:hypothetical protein